MSWWELLEYGATMSEIRHAAAEGVRLDGLSDLGETMLDDGADDLRSAAT